MRKRILADPVDPRETEGSTRVRSGGGVETRGEGTVVAAGTFNPSAASRERGGPVGRGEAMPGRDAAVGGRVGTGMEDADDLVFARRTRVERRGVR